MRRRWPGTRALALGAVVVGAVSMGTVAACGGTGPEHHPIEGEWIWVRAFGGIAGTEITPQTTGYSMTIEFVGQTARVLRNGALFAETTVEIRDSDDTGRLGTVLYGQPILGWPEQAFRLGSGDTLTLTDGCCDGFEYTFARVP